MQIIDLAIAIEDNLPSDPPPTRPHIDYLDHEKGTEELIEFTGVAKDELPNDYLGKAVDCYNDTLVNPDNYNIIQQTPRPGYEAAHKHTHKTTGLFIIVADSSQDILSFGGRTP